MAQHTGHRTSFSLVHTVHWSGPWSRVAVSVPQPCAKTERAETVVTNIASSLRHLASQSGAAPAT